MLAYAIKHDLKYCVVLAGQCIKSYSAPDNAKRHRDAINMAIQNPPNLNQKPSR
jgi:hypothetical protein